MPDDYQPWSPPGNTPYNPVVIAESSLPPQRGGCLTAWLVLAIVGRVFMAVLYPVMYSRATHPGFTLTPLVTGLLVAASLGGIVCIIALFQWRRWGFYGLLAIDVLVSLLNFSIGISPFRVLTGLLGIVILYLLLNAGGSNSAWRHLK